MLTEDFEPPKQKIEIAIPKGWSLHVNGRKDHVFLVDPNGEKIIFLLDNIPYLCVTNVLVYITYQLTNFMKINDITIDNIEIEHHSNVSIDFKIKSEQKTFNGKIRLTEINGNLKLIGILTESHEKPDIDLAIELLGLN